MPCPATLKRMVPLVAQGARLEQKLQPRAVLALVGAQPEVRSTRGGGRAWAAGEQAGAPLPLLSARPACPTPACSMWPRQQAAPGSQQLRCSQPLGAESARRHRARAVSPTRSNSPSKRCNSRMLDRSSLAQARVELGRGGCPTRVESSRVGRRKVPTRGESGSNSRRVGVQLGPTRPQQCQLACPTRANST